MLLKALPVLRCHLLQPEWNPAVIPLPAVVTLDLADSLFHTHKGVLGKEFFDYYAGSSLRYRVTAVCDHQKTDDYARYEPFILTLFRIGFTACRLFLLFPFACVPKLIRMILQPLLS
jgi:hypothetical protein